MGEPGTSPSALHTMGAFLIRMACSFQGSLNRGITMRGVVWYYRGLNHENRVSLSVLFEGATMQV